MTILKFVSPRIYLLFFFFPFMMQSILLMDELLTAISASNYVMLMNVSCVDYQVLIARKPLSTVFTLVLFTVQKAYAHNIASMLNARY